MKRVGFLSALILTTALTTVLTAFPSAAMSSTLNLPSLGDTTSGIIFTAGRVSTGTLMAESPS